MVLNPFERFRYLLEEKAANLNMPAVTYVAFGDSVTQGIMQHGVYEYERLYHQIFRRYIEQRYPGTVLNVINSGVGGDTATGSLSRWERDVRRYHPDLITIMFGHNDVHAQLEGIPAYIDAIDELVQRVKRETEAEILLITPCMMMTQDNERIAPVHKELVPQFIALAENGTLHHYVNSLRKYVADRNIACLDAYSMWEAMVAQGIDIHTRLSNGINHPDQLFHMKLGRSLFQMLDEGIQVGPA